MTPKERATALERSEVGVKEQGEDDLPIVGAPTSVVSDDLSGRTAAEAGPFPTPQGEPRSLSPLVGESSGCRQHGWFVLWRGWCWAWRGGGVAERSSTSQTVRRVAARLPLQHAATGMTIYLHHRELVK